MVQVNLTKQEFRKLLDLAYIGNWVINAERDDKDREPAYDALTSKIFAHCFKSGDYRLVEIVDGIVRPTKIFADSGVHDIIMQYEDTTFFEILAEELARRDMGFPPIDDDNVDTLNERMDEYIEEFEQNGIENVTISV